MTNFWNLEKFQNQIAIYTDSGEKLSYGDILKKIEPVEKILKSNSHSLVFCKCKNDINSIVNYIAALRSNCPVLLIDEEINKKYLSTLIKSYNPQFILGDEIIELDSNFKCYKELAVLLSTSGSTGNPKLVRLSKLNIQDNAESIAKYLEINQSDRALTTLPFHYSYGLSIINSHLLVGASILLTEDSIISKKFWDFTNDYKATSIAGVPYTFDMLKKLRFENMQISSLRYMTQAGGKLPFNLAKHFTKTCIEKNIEFYIMYGQTEASPRMSFFKTNDALEKLESIGKAIPGGKLYLNNEKGYKIENINEQGELIYEGLNVMLGYAYKQNDLKKSEELNGVLHTGDLAHFDKDGYFYITGRKNRFTKIHGLRINLDDISNYLINNNIDGVAIGTDKNICIASTQEIDEKMKKMLQKEYKLHHSIIKIIYVDEIPKNSAGKVLYSKIKEMFNGK